MRSEPTLSIWPNCNY